MSKHWLIICFHTYIFSHLFFSLFLKGIKSLLECGDWELNYSALKMLWDPKVNNVIVPQIFFFLLVLTALQSLFCIHYFISPPAWKGDGLLILVAPKTQCNLLQMINTRDSFIKYSQNKSTVLWSWIISHCI